MSFRINTNTQAALSLSSLNKTSNEIGMRQLRLATGSKINSAADDSAGFTISNKLTATTRGQAQALSNIGDAKSMLTVAEGALGSTMDILQTMKEKAIQAGNDTYGSEERAAIQTQLDALSSEIDDILGGAEFNGKKLFSGTDTLDNGNTGTSLSFQVGAAAGQTFGVEFNELGTDSLSKTATVGGTNAAKVESATFSGDADVATGTFAIAAGTSAGTFKLTYNDGSTTVDLADDVASLDDFKGASYSTADGISVTLDADATFVSGDTFTVAGDASAALDLDVSTAETATAALAQIDGAIAKINKAAGRIGDSQNRLDFKAQNLETSMNNYEAANSRIKDADFAKEQMEVVKLQILQQTGSAMFAQSNAAPQSVLSFF
ncbi:flagellin [Rubrivirga sp.]|uniref:flagellin N-terminal helical domain-containing protein n=1 Tax=Rubrivirga sp. TaxID=1885344 RepID=UPI003B51BA61